MMTKETIEQVACIVGLAACDQRKTIKRRKQLAELQAVLINELKEANND